MNRIVVDMQKLQHNINIVKSKIKNIHDDMGENPTIIAVLKGNAYGMGDILVAQKMVDNNINYFAVSQIEEGIRLRENGFLNKILLLQSTSIEEEVENIIKYDLIPTIGSSSAAEMANKVAGKENKILDVHLKIDTGFGRFGFVSSHTSCDEIVSTFSKCNNLKIVGTYSHFYESYSNSDKNTKKQFDSFIDMVIELKKQKIDTGMLHICNSPAFFKFPNMYLNAVRIGSAFTGNVQIKENTGLQKVAYFESDVCEIKALPKGYTIGYSGTEKLKQDTQVAILEAGYADGIGINGKKDSITLIDKLRLLKNTCNYNKRVVVDINGNKCPVLGRIGMKNIVIDITNKNIKVGDKAKINTNLVFVDSNIIRQELC